MKKAMRITALFLAMTVFVGANANLNALAESTPDGFDIRNGVLVKYSGNAADVTIPDGVIAISDEAFQMNDSLKSVVLPGSVESIGSQAFLECNHLSSVTLEKGLKTIGNSAFCGCKALTGIVIPEGTTTIGQDAFYFSGLASVTLQNGLTTIGSYAFSHTKLTSVTIPEGVTKVDDGAFSDCTALASVTFPTLLTDFGQEIFDRTEWLQKYPDDFVIVNGALITYKGSGGNIVVPGTVKKISPYVLSGNLSLTHVTVSEGVTQIGDHAFERDTNLTGISLPDSLTRIGEDAFQQSGLTNIILPRHLVELGRLAFEQCDSLKTASIPGTLNLIGDYAFFWCRNLFEVTLAPGIKSIGEGTFDGCSALRTIALPSGLKAIGNRAFLACTSLTGISLPNSITFLGDAAFMRCYQLSSLTLSTGLTDLGPEVFRECSALQTLSVPNGVKKVEACSFLDCALTRAFIPASVNAIDANAFNSSTGRQQESVPKIYGYIGTEAQKFATKYKYTFVSLGSVPVPLILDTSGTYNFGSRSTYLYLAKTGSSVAPKAVSSNPKAISVSFVRKTGNGYLFRINRVGQGTAVITTRMNNETASFTAKAGPSLKSDTTRPFAMRKGSYYTFKLTVMSTSNSAPQFSVGSGNLKAQYIKKSGKDYYYRIQAVGALKSSTGIYSSMTGETGSRICVVTIA